MVGEKKDKYFLPQFIMIQAYSDRTENTLICLYRVYVHSAPQDQMLQIIIPDLGGL